ALLVCGPPRVLVAAALPFAVARAAAQKIEDFALFGDRELSLGRFTHVGSGDVGVNRNTGNGLVIGEHVLLEDGCTVVGGAVDILKGASVDDVLTDNLSASPDATIRGSIDPLGLGRDGSLLTLPPLPAMQPGTQDVEVPQDGTQELAPGAYGNVALGRRGTLRLTGGGYYLRRLRRRSDAAIRVLAPVEVRIALSFRVGARAFIGPMAGSGIGANDISFQIGAPL